MIAATTTATAIEDATARDCPPDLPPKLCDIGMENLIREHPTAN
jgi:hypothetical protein